MQRSRKVVRSFAAPVRNRTVTEDLANGRLDAAFRDVLQHLPIIARFISRCASYLRELIDIFDKILEEAVMTPHHVECRLDTGAGVQPRRTHHQWSDNNALGGRL